MNDFMERLTELVDIPINELRCIFSDVPYLVAEKPSSSSIRQARLESKGETRGGMVRAILGVEFPNLHTIDDFWNHYEH